MNGVEVKLNLIEANFFNNKNYDEHRMSEIE